MGDALPFLDLGTGLSASAVATTVTGSCAVVRETKGLKCWVRDDAREPRATTQRAPID